MTSRNGSRGHVLIVDDDPVLRMLLQRSVEIGGWSVDAAGCLADAIHAIETHQYGAVVLDLSLGEQEGVSLLRHFKLGPDSPFVIFLSGMDSRVKTASVRLASAMGVRVAGTLSKPFVPGVLREMLEASPAFAEKDLISEANITGGLLEQALSEQQIVVEYQPKVDLCTNRIVGMEALARWRRSTAAGQRAMEIPPEVFVKAAEDNDLIDRLTRKVLHDSLAACRRWRVRHPECGVAVNFSPLVLSNPTLPEEILIALRAAGLPAAALTVEITESTVIANPVLAAEVLTRLRIKGVRVSIDDFGTGHSSLLTLLRLPFTELKIDKSFVACCDTDSEAWKIIRATISMGRELGLSIVAEGIEFPEIARMLGSAGCATGQGWHFGRSMTEDALTDWLAEHAPAHRELTLAAVR